MDSKLEAILRKAKGGEANTPYMYEMVDTYYQCVIGNAADTDESENDTVDIPFPEELLQPVEERNSGIGTALTRLLDSGYDVDGSDGYFNALMLAVGEGDAPMVHFLIDHGADANSWPGMEETVAGEGNYYLDDIDIHFMHECFARDKDVDYLKALHRTALVLAEDAHLGPYSGYSLKIDEAGDVSLEPAQVKF